MRVNLFGTFHFTKTFVSGMVEEIWQNRQFIFYQTSCCVPNLHITLQTKAAIAGFIKSLALEMAPYGINVNAVAPGAIDVGGKQADVLIAQIVRQFL
jgi:3-oxoacyl-[acyl-carrier protein] reductase